MGIPYLLTRSRVKRRRRSKRSDSSGDLWCGCDEEALSSSDDEEGEVAEWAGDLVVRGELHGGLRMGYLCVSKGRSILFQVEIDTIFFPKAKCVEDIWAFYARFRMNGRRTNGRPPWWFLGHNG